MYHLAVKTFVGTPSLIFDHFNALVVGNLAMLPRLAYRNEAVSRMDGPEGHERENSHLRVMTNLVGREQSF